MTTTTKQFDKSEKTALVVGASGLIGGYCLDVLCKDPSYSEIIALVRKPILKTHRKLKIIINKFDNLEDELSKIKADDVYCCLGTTIKKAGSQEEFKKIDFSLVVSIAELMRKQGAQQFLVISSIGADSNSKIFYNRVKAEMELALKALEYPHLRVIRPSLLLGTRNEFRLGERLGVLLSPVFSPLMVGSLKKYRPVHAEKVAQFMVRAAHGEQTSMVSVYESDQIL